MQKKDRKIQQAQLDENFDAAKATPEDIMEQLKVDNSKANIIIKKFATLLKDAGIPNCIMAWDIDKSRYVFAGAMPEECGYSSKDLTRFIRFLELCTDFNKDDYKLKL